MNPRREGHEDDARDDALFAHLSGKRHQPSFPSHDQKQPHATRRDLRRVVLVMLTLALLRAVHVSYGNADAATKALAHLYYQAPAIALAAVWLWGVNVWIWKLMKLNPHPLVVWHLSEVKAHLTDMQVFAICTWSGVGYLTSLTAFLRFANGAASAGDSFGNNQVALETTNHNLWKAHLSAAFVYVTPLLVLLMPVATGVYPHTCGFFKQTMWRCLTSWRNKPVRFGDFFLADVLCSLAKSVSDLERSTCALLAGPHLMFSRKRDPKFGTCGSHSWHVPFMLALPSVVRLAQCLRQRADGGFLVGTDVSGKSALEKQKAKQTATANAAKYFSVFPVIFLSHLKYVVSVSCWTSLIRPLWITCAVCNTALSFYWDVAHDWELGVFGAVFQGFFGTSSAKNSEKNKPSNSPASPGTKIAGPPSHHKAGNKYLRPRLLYGPPIVYYCAISLNFLLRLSWTYKLSSHLRHNAASVLTFSVLEISRRFLWSLFRVEKAYLARQPLWLGGRA